MSLFLSIFFITLLPSKELGENSFALHMHDGSMTPELKMSDLLIVDPEQTIRPGGLVVTQLQDSKEASVRRYKQLSAGNPMQEYELIAANENWASIQVSNTCGHKIIGIVLAFFRLC